MQERVKNARKRGLLYLTFTLLVIIIIIITSYYYKKGNPLECIKRLDAAVPVTYRCLLTHPARCISLNQALSVRPQRESSI